MKRNPILRTTLSAAFAGIAFLTMTQPAFAEGKPHRSYIDEPVKEEPAKKKSKITTLNSRYNNVVKIVPDIIKKDMHVTARKNDGKELDFFVFDVEGTLVQNYRMKSKDHYRITGLKKGIYIYRVFMGDEETAAGKFEIK